MEQTEQYVNMMIDSLRKKDELLDAILQQNELQTEIVSRSELDLDAFKVVVDEKQKLIDEINKLDEGFQFLFDKIKHELTTKKVRYTSEIRQMQDYIKKLSEKGIQIQSQEERNRLSVQGHFSKMKKEVKVAKRSMSAATNYYKTMSKTTVVDSQFMDKKK